MTNQVGFTPKNRSILEICDHLHTRLSSAPTATLELAESKHITSCISAIQKRRAPRHWSHSAEELQTRVTHLTALEPSLTDQKVKEQIHAVIDKLKAEIAKKPTPGRTSPPRSPSRSPSPEETVAQDINRIVNSLLNPRNNQDITKRLTHALTCLNDENFVLPLGTLRHMGVQHLTLCTLIESKRLDGHAHLGQIKNLITSLDTCIARSSIDLDTAKIVDGIPIGGVHGISNEGGNDCFLVALCQMLQRDPLRRYLVDQLPDVVWETLAANQLNSTAIRLAITNNTSFGPNVRGADLDPMLAQLDPTEVLPSLMEAADPRSHAPRQPPQTPPPNPSTPADPPRSSFFGKIFQAIGNFFRWLFLKILGYADEPTLHLPPTYPSFYYQPEVSAGRRAQREAAIEYSRNPLITPIVKNVTRRSPNNATIEKTSTQTDPTGILPIGMHKNGADQYSFRDMFTAYFTDEVIQDPREWITTNHVFERLPQYMTLSFKRSIAVRKDDGSLETRKISDDIEDIDLTFRIPDEALSAADRASAENKEYSLTSFVAHKGKEARSGHYVAYRKEGADWYYFNDGALPVPCSEEDIQKAVKQAYLVFYERNA